MLSSNSYLNQAGISKLTQILLVASLILFLVIIGTVILMNKKSKVIIEETKGPCLELTPTGQKIPKVIKSYVGKITSLLEEESKFTLEAKAERNFLTEDKIFVVIAHHKTQINGAGETESETKTDLGSLEIGERVVVSSRANIKDKETIFADRIVTDVSEETTTTQGEYAQEPSFPYITFGGQEMPPPSEETPPVPKEIPKEVLGYVGEIVSISPTEKQFYLLAEERRNYILEDTYFSVSVKESTLMNERTIDGSKFNNINFEDLKLGDFVTVVSNSNIKGLESFAADRITRITME